jgi:hypothetical protein
MVILSTVALIIVALILVFEIMMIISAIKNRAISDKARILWVIGMLLIHPIVAIIYYFTDHKKAH